MARQDATDLTYVGRYVLHDEIASGGMGTVHLGRLRGGAGFSRIVAIKRLNPLLAKQAEFLHMFLDEARLAGRVRHPNVVPIIDVVEADGEVLLVMEYVHGEALSRLVRLTRVREQLVSPAVVSAVLSGVLYGLHAAHEATDERGEALGIVHRDVSPQNILVGSDGVARLVDFGVAKATGRLQTTSEGQIKGKLSYMPPEQIQGQPVDRRADVYGVGVVLWEALTGKRLFAGDNQGHIMRQVLLGDVQPPSRLVDGLPPALDDVVLKALGGDPADRFSTAREMCAALLDACPAAPPHVVSEWVEACVHESLTTRSARVAELESATSVSVSVGRERDASEALASQVSSISVTGDLAVSRPRRSRALVVAATGGALVVGSIIAWWTTSRSPLPAPVVLAPPPVVVPAPIVSAPLAPPAPPVASPLAAVDAAPPPVRTAAPRPPPHPRMAPPAHLDCNPPWVRSADGHKQWKRECLGSGT
jgi:serine/threonine-protein kinase